MDQVNVSGSFENEINSSDDYSSLSIVETSTAGTNDIIIPCSSNENSLVDIVETSIVETNNIIPCSSNENSSAENSIIISSESDSFEHGEALELPPNYDVQHPVLLKKVYSPQQSGNSVATVGDNDSDLKIVVDESTVEQQSNFQAVKTEIAGRYSFHPSCEAGQNGQLHKNNYYCEERELSVENKFPTLNLKDVQDQNTSGVEHKSIEAEQLMAEMERLKFEITETENEIRNKNSTLKSVDINNLPDKGLKLKVAVARDVRNLGSLNEQLKRVGDKFNLLFDKNKKVQNRQDELTDQIGVLPSANLQDMGKRALEAYRVEQALTVDSLQRIHNSLRTCPSEETEESDPITLKVPLMSHQKQALAWLLWREREVPSGGILADDMGLGKTLTMLSLIAKRNEANFEDNSESSDDENSDKGNEKKLKRYKGGTLIVCPASIIGQWECEIDNKIKSNTLTCQTFHGTNREKKARRLAKPDIIITTYTIVRVEAERCEKNLVAGGCLRDSPLYAVKWKRIILDEAHIIRNHRSKTADSVFKLKGKHRWALTGTPIHNKTEDFFSLVKFLRCRPFDELDVWKRWVEAKEESGMKRMNMLTKSLMLRRTKDVLNTEGMLDNLPEKISHDIRVQLSDSEYALYEEVSNFSKNLLCQLLFQKAEKENCSLGNFSLKPSNIKKNNSEDNPFSGHPALEGLYNKVARMGNVQTHTILVLLLRLRQICCHPALMKSMIEKEALAEDGIQDGLEENLLDRMSSLSIDDNNKETVDETSKVWDLKNPLFNPNLKSAKVNAIIDLLENNLLKTNDKIVIVSQWTSMLDILYGFLKKIDNCKCDLLTGKIPVPQRMHIVNDFNKKSSHLKVLLLSLTAGGVGLNLIGGNHLILTDVHWNPQLEAQACDRVYRLGQKKPVNVYKFKCSGTIEERIELVQLQKLELSDNILSGSKKVKSSCLTLNDLMTLFNIDDPRTK